MPESEFELAVSVEALFPLAVSEDEAGAGLACAGCCGSDGAAVCGAVGAGCVTGELVLLAGWLAVGWVAGPSAADGVLTFNSSIPEALPAFPLVSLVVEAGAAVLAGGVVAAGPAAVGVEAGAAAGAVSERGAGPFAAGASVPTFSMVTLPSSPLPFGLVVTLITFLTMLGAPVCAGSVSVGSPVFAADVMEAAG